MKTECKTKELVLFFAEVHLILWKDNENREQKKTILYCLRLASSLVTRILQFENS